MDNKNKDDQNSINVSKEHSGGDALLSPQPPECSELMERVFDTYGGDWRQFYSAAAKYFTQRHKALQPPVEHPFLRECPWCGVIPDEVEHFPAVTPAVFDVRCRYRRCPRRSISGRTPQEAADRWNIRAAPWQPIETAPINQSVLIYIPNAEHYGEGIYRAIWIESDWMVNDKGEHPRHWQTTGLHHGRDVGSYGQPTHWMPLPATPEVNVPAN